ncbi:hypothetical protein GNQ08_21360 [Paenibacillus macerans]|uniref:Uncharacterized protein n=1 Tax=Paenibacillus macerans TaxID=44252 RepID=A0A6N8EXI9_PAEMA|nr:hypothetical protein [Paenibacillus macerans]MUG24916.1 hypothetical protein [Paenibacillus macerans]
MTEQHKKSLNYVEFNEQLIARYQELLLRQVEGAYRKGEMEPDAYLNFLSVVCEADTRNGIYDHFEGVFGDLIDYHEERLQARILKGAEYIESIGPQHPKYAAAVRKYNALCEKLQEQQGRRRENGRGGRDRLRFRNAQ